MYVWGGIYGNWDKEAYLKGGYVLNVTWGRFGDLDSRRTRYYETVKCVVQEGVRFVQLENPEYDGP